MSSVAGMELWSKASISRCEAFTSAAQVAAQHPAPQPRRSAGSSTGEGHQVGRGTESSGRRRFDRSARFASRFAGGSPRGTASPHGSTNRGMPSFHRTFPEAVGKVGRGTDERERAVGRRSETNGQVSGRDGQDSAINHTASVRDHTARKDSRSRGRARSFEGTSQRDGDRARGGKEETFQIFVGAFSRFGWQIRFDVARVGSQRTRGAKQRSNHGDVDQSRQHVGGEFESIQSVGLMHNHISTARRVTVWGARGVRVGEAKNPGPQDRDEGATQLDNGTTESGTQVAALEFDLTHQDSSSETDTVSVCSEIHRREDAPRNRRLRLVWNNESIPQWHHREVRGAERLVRELAGRIGCVPLDAPLPRAVRQQRWSPLNVPLMWGAAGNAESVPVLDWITQMCQRITEPLTFLESNVIATEAVGLGWASL